jgi:regulator of extracellular matrix RemA (YlzA/DUF370 family)
MREGKRGRNISKYRCYSVLTHLVYGRRREVVILVNEDVILSSSTLYEGVEERL